MSTEPFIETIENVKQERGGDGRSSPHTQPRPTASEAWGFTQSGRLRQSWEPPAGWPLPPAALACRHRPPLVTAKAGAGSGSVRPASTAGQPITAIIPTPQGPEGHTAALARPWAPTHPLDLSSLYQAVAKCKRGAARAQERDGRRLSLGSLPSCTPACEPVSLFPTSTPDSSPKPSPPEPVPCTLPVPALRYVDTAQHRGPEFRWVLYFFLMRCTLLFFFFF